MTSSSTHRLSQVERAMAQLADTLRLLEARDQQRREEELRMREQDRQVHEAERQAREADREQDRRAGEEAKREWNRERGEIARKLGTVVEDIVAPSIPRVVAAVFGLDEENPLERFAIREQRRANTERPEI